MKTALLSIAAAAAASSPSSAQAQLAITPVALTGQAATGAGSAIYHKFKAPQVNASGQVLFWGQLSDNGQPDWANDQGLWMGQPNALQLVARGSEPNTDSYSFSYPTLSDTGQVAFMAASEHLTTMSTWAGSPGALRLIARENGPLPVSDPDLRVWYPGLPQLSNSGQMIIKIIAAAELFNRETPTLWTGSVDSLHRIALKGEAAPGTTDGATYHDFNTPIINPSGQIAYYATLRGPSVIQGSNDAAIYVGSPDVPQLLARGGSPAVGVNANYGMLRLSPFINRAGQVAFTDFNGIWIGKPGQVQLVACVDQPAPGLPAGTQYKSIAGYPVLNDAGQVAFVAGLTGGDATELNTLALFVGPPNQLRRLVREGNPVPGVPGAFFRSIEADDNYSPALIHPLLNAQGQVAFLGNLVADDIEGVHNRGLFATDLEGIIHLIAREGAPFDLGNGESRFVQTIDIQTTPAWGPTPYSFNDAGELAFRLVFTDGSEGIFIAHTGVPEPSLLGALAPILLFWRRGRASR